MDGDILDGVAEIMHTGVLGTEGDVGGSGVFNDLVFILDPTEDGVFAPDDVLIILEDVGHIVVGDGDAGAFGHADVGENVGEENAFKDHRGDLRRTLSVLVLELISGDVGLGKIMRLGLIDGIGDGFAGGFDDDRNGPGDVFKRDVGKLGSDNVRSLGGAGAENGGQHRDETENGDDLFH